MFNSVGSTLRLVDLSMRRKRYIFEVHMRWPDPFPYRPYLYAVKRKLRLLHEYGAMKYFRGKHD